MGDEWAGLKRHEGYMVNIFNSYTTYGGDKSSQVAIGTARAGQGILGLYI